MSESGIDTDTRVFLSKMEGIGRATIINGHPQNGPYASRCRLVVHDGVAFAGVDGGVLREKVERTITSEGGEIAISRGGSLELSCEYLLELSLKARSRDLIALEQEPSQSV